MTGPEKRQEMKVFWWQGGLHIEPENEQEVSALALLGSHFVNVNQGVETRPIVELHNEKAVV